MIQDEYDFSNAEQGKLYVPVENIEIPIYLDKEIVQYLNEKCLTKQSYRMRRTKKSASFA
jgi:hypothetical protein